jgi:HEAT repeat protein
VPDALALLKTAAADKDPRVRLQAVRAASFFHGKGCT